MDAQTLVALHDYYHEQSWYRRAMLHMPHVCLFIVTERTRYQVRSLNQQSLHPGIRQDLRIELVALGAESGNPGTFVPICASKAVMHLGHSAGPAFDLSAWRPARPDIGYRLTA